MAEAEVKETSIKTIKNIIFMYTSITRPVEQLNTDNKPPVTDHDLEFHSFEVKILISEDRFKNELKKKFKGAKNLPNAKEFDAEEVLEKFGLEVEDDMVLVKFSQSCLVGKATSRRASFPITQIGIKGKVQDINGNTIDQDTSIGNGTKGHFQFRPIEGKNGLYLYPHTVCVTELVEYTATGGEEDLESLGLEELDETDMDKEAEEQEQAIEANESAEPTEAVEGTVEKAGEFKDPMF